MVELAQLFFVIVVTDRQTDRHTDDMPKMTFLDSVTLKTWRFIKISRSVFWTNAILYRESKNIAAMVRMLSMLCDSEENVSRILWK